MLIDLACLYYHARNNSLNFDEGVDACVEVCRLAWLLGYSVNDMAKLLVME